MTSFSGFELKRYRLFISRTKFYQTVLPSRILFQKRYLLTINNLVTQYLFVSHLSPRISCNLFQYHSVIESSIFCLFGKRAWPVLLVLGCILCAKLHIPSTINTVNDLLSTLIWAPKKLLVSVRLACTFLRNITVQFIILNFSSHFYNVLSNKKLGK